MKIIYVFIYFLLFIPAYCDLIPNNRVIADPSSTNDFNLVEGITYKIVHLRTGLNLDGMMRSSPLHYFAGNNPF